MNPPLAWFRKIIASVLLGLSDGFKAAAGASIAGQTFAHTPISGAVVLLTMGMNAAFDVATFVRENPDPWAYQIPAPKPQPVPPSP